MTVVGRDVLGAPQILWDGFKDALSIVSHWRGKIKDNQYKQALDLFNGLLLTYPSSG